MKGSTIVRLGFILSGVLFVFAALKPAFKGGSLDATFLILGAACTVLGVVIGRKPEGGPPAGT